ncbi:MAG: tetraacyldisaccharide 4'-kinase [Phycisphaerales bacterium]|nr:tetraacyldisaccharide 4'-kinase [Phycisphaerales bacterium]
MIPEHRPTRLPVFLASALSKIYSIGINRQNARYDRGVNVTQLKRPVISIGNISAGGTGKTPMVQHIVKILLEHGRHPVIAMRGYKSKPGVAGDEQLEHMQALPDVPVVAQPDRIAGLNMLFSSDEGKQVDCVVLDDGFQHRKIQRDLDIVLIDASRPPTCDALLPLGFLREPMSSLKRADVIVLTHAEQVTQAQLDALTATIQVHIEGQEILIAEHEWTALLRAEWDTSREQYETQHNDVESLRGVRAAILTGIGHPEAFASMASDHGVQAVHRCDRPDHSAYTSAFLSSFLRDSKARGAECILTTQKDWSKIRQLHPDSLNQEQIPFCIPFLGIRFLDGGNCLSESVKSAF